MRTSKPLSEDLQKLCRVPCVVLAAEFHLATSNRGGSPKPHIYIYMYVYIGFRVTPQPTPSNRMAESCKPDTVNHEGLGFRVQAINSKTP